MFTAKTVIAITVGAAAALAGAIHLFGPDAMRALGQLIHGGR